MRRSILPFLVGVAGAAFAAALGLFMAGRTSPALAAHVAFAIGVLPLIFAALLYFVPVLTRSETPAAPLRYLPLLPLAAGVLVVAAFHQPAFFNPLVHAAAALALVAALIMAAWIVRRGRATLGAPHPGLHWYLAAVLCLVLALLAAMILPAWPQQRAALRLFHLHLNTLGFVGLAALGTLAVLLPTAAAKPDPQAAHWLRRMRTPSLAGALLVAAGAAGWPPLAYAGALLLFVPVLWLGRGWLREFSAQVCGWHGAVPVLALALTGWGSLLLLGALHAAGAVSARQAIPGFLLAFLLPLVTGAAGQLLPVWLRPGAQGDWHRATRVRLGRHAVLRGLTFLLGGGLVAFGWTAGLWLALAGLAVFFAQALRALTGRQGSAD